MNHELAAYLNCIALLDHDGRETEFRIANLVLNRPDAANAFSGDLLVQIIEILKKVEADPSIRILIIQGSGKHFSAGADLHWMKASALLDKKQNIQEALKLTHMFETLSGLNIPTIAVVKGAAFGGAVGLIAACDFAIAADSCKICLSEARIGLIPAVILPYLQRKIPSGMLNRMVMTSNVIEADEAYKIGLVSKVAGKNQLEDALRSELNGLLQTSPEAQSAYKVLASKLVPGRQDPMTAEAIASIRSSEMGQAGLQSFFQKSNPPWLVNLPKGTAFVVS